MTKLIQYQIDSFSKEIFKGNPAAVIILKQWLDDAIMQNIALENNLSETAFVVQNNDHWHIRWFTPLAEVDLCGHATLATAYVLFEINKVETEELTFESRSGLLKVRKNGDWYDMDFPVDFFKPSHSNLDLTSILGQKPVCAFEGKTDLICIMPNESAVRSCRPDFNAIKDLPYRGLLISSAGEEYDFVSRFFAPACGINEDPVTGSAHTSLTPIWAKALNKTKMKAKQLSPRTGEIMCEMKGDRVIVSGQAVLFSKSEISI